MKLTRKELAEAMYALLNSKASSATFAEGVAEYLVEERRTGELDAIMREVERLRSERDGVNEAVVNSANELDENVRQMIRDMFGGKETVLVERKDASLVGGVQVQTLDKSLDLSVRGQLNKLKNSNFRG